MLTPEQSAVIARLRVGGEPALTSYFVENRQQLRSLVEARIVPALKARVDGSDVLQEAFLRAQKEYAVFVQNPRTSTATWLQRICMQTLSDLCRKHVEAQRRSVDREAFSLDPLSDEIDQDLGGRGSTPSSHFRKKERVEVVFGLIQSMKQLDRDILYSVHIDNMTLREAAAHLNIEYDAAKKRYRRAVIRLSQLAKSHY